MMIIFVFFLCLGWYIYILWYTYHSLPWHLSSMDPNLSCWVGCTRDLFTLHHCVEHCSLMAIKDFQHHKGRHLHCCKSERSFLSFFGGYRNIRQSEPRNHSLQSIIVCLSAICQYKQFLHDSCHVTTEKSLWQGQAATAYQTMRHTISSRISIKVRQINGPRSRTPRHWSEAPHVVNLVALQAWHHQF